MSCYYVQFKTLKPAIDADYRQFCPIINIMLNTIFSFFSNTADACTIIIDDGSTIALPSSIVLDEGQEATITTEIKAMSDSGERYSHTIRRTVIGIAGNPPGAIKPVGAVQELGMPVTGIFTPFGIDFALTNQTGHIHFKGQAGRTITVTIQESKD